MHVVFDPHPAVPREVHARLDGDHRVGRQGIGVGLRESRRFVHLEPEPVTERMAERLAEPPRRDRIARQRVGIPPGHAGTHTGTRALLRFADQSVQHPLPLGCPRPHHHGARDVRTVAVHLSPEV